jgi:hypothetical protein
MLMHGAIQHALHGDADEREAARLDRQGGYDIVHEARHQSQDEITASRRSIIDSMGGNEKVADRFLGEYTKNLSLAIQDKKNFLFKDDATHKSDLRRVFEESAANVGQATDMLSFEDATNFALKNAESMSGTKANVHDQPGVAEYKSGVDRAMAQRDALHTKLFNHDGYGEDMLSFFTDAGKRRRHDETADHLFGGGEDSRISLLAVLKAAAEDGSAIAKERVTEYEAHLRQTVGDEKEAQRLIDRGGTMYSAASPSQRQTMRQAGEAAAAKRYAGYTTTDAEGNEITIDGVAGMEAHMSDAQKQRFAVKSDVQLAKGYADMGLSKEVIGDVLSPTAVLQRMVESRSQLKGAGKEWAERYDKALGEQDTEGAARVAEEFRAAVQGGAPVSESRRGGGASAHTKDLEQTHDILATMSAEMAQNFPAAVETFRDASVALRDAASHMGTRLPGLINLNFGSPS